MIKNTATFLGTPPFPVAAREALADSQLRGNLRHATHTIREKRAKVVGELDDFEQLRVAAKDIKDDVLGHLDSYLEQLETSLIRAGATVHWARDAAEANRIVTDIVRSHKVDEVVKVKSMATMEIELNPALEAAGISVWETDLAELIVQLGNDLPSHILVPAIHRNRSEVREIFLREMGKAGMPAEPDLSDDPVELAGAARRHLREKFLRAKVAISGANFAIAETGSLVVVESEGNGRMCLTLPEVLISVVGIEKTLPTWADMEVFMQLLPRSATGERMNPYTSTWNGVTEGDGPQEVHVILLDNGRTKVLADEVGRQALRCIRCSACLNICPVYERAGGHAYGSIYPGPIGAILTPMLRGIGASESSDSLPFASTLCGACYEVCPVLINIPEVLVHLREKVVDSHRGGVPGALQVAMSGASLTLRKSSLLGLLQSGAGIAGRVLGRQGLIGRMPAPLSRWTDARDAPAPPQESFRKWWARTDGGKNDSGPNNKERSNKERSNKGRKGRKPA
jgi:L-lactate dehydrogenase complex protein LldF